MNEDERAQRVQRWRFVVAKLDEMGRNFLDSARLSMNKFPNGARDQDSWGCGRVKQVLRFAQDDNFCEV